MKPKTNTPSDTRRDTRASSKVNDSTPMRSTDSVSSAINWVECSKCSEWILYENCGIKGPFDSCRVQKEVIECRCCKLTSRIFTLETDRNNMLSRLVAVEEHLEKLDTLRNELEEKDTVISELNDKVRVLTEENTKLTQTVTEIKRKADHIEEHKDTAANSENLSTAQIKQASDEIKEIELRKNNVVIWGLAENGDDKKDIIRFVNDCHYNLRPIGPENIVRTERLGKAVPNRSRMLRVVTDGTDTRKNMLGLHRMRKSEHETSKVFIRPDLTKSQQEADKRLREEWTIKGRDRFVIKGGKVVPRLNTTLEGASDSRMRSARVRTNDGATMGGSTSGNTDLCPTSQENDTASRGLNV